MPTDSASNRRTVPVVVGVLVALLALGLLTARWFHQRHLEALFSGPCVDSSERGRQGFYAAPLYKLAAYRAAEDEDGGTATPGLLGRSAEDERFDRVIEGIHPEYRLDTSTRATRVARLREPSAYKAPWVSRFLTITYPPEGAVFPSNLCAPSVDWTDTNNDLWQITVSIPHAKLEWKFLTKECRWRVPEDIWQQVKERAVADKASIQVRGVKRRGLWSMTRDNVHRSQLVSFRVSKHPADNVIVYRLVDPPFVNRKTPDLFIRDIRRHRSKMFLNARQQYCVNCHTFSTKSGTHGKVSVQVRYVGSDPADPAVYLAVFDMDKDQGQKTILPFDVQMSTFMAWSPDETKLAIAARQRFAPRTGPVVFETQTIGQDSDIAVYDSPEGTAKLLPGASEPKVLETYPRWTPDGKSLVYSSAPVGKHPSITQLDLYVIPYNEGRGGTAKPVPGASKNKKSNFYARFSLDGKWMSWVQANYASLIKASSDIYIMPADLNGVPRKLASNVPHAADSWHSWSSNSRWILFVTKRDNGIFARLYMTHIDDEGKASPAVRLPIENPRMRMSFNIPEFMAQAPPVQERRLFEGICIRAQSFHVRSNGAPANETDSK